MPNSLPMPNQRVDPTIWNEKPYFWKCECGRGFTMSDVSGSTKSTLFGLTVRQIAKLRTRWLRDGNRIEDI